ncbi:MAG TPA: hypothetical protein VLU43_13345 [Anaeromyxobacteraceae bacterium]|nr:hypothetical protein [Anaeromyxobacteraceae bacterium]
MTVQAIVLACTLAASPAAQGAAAAAPPQPVAGEFWRAARWGMTAEEVVKAFPGEAVRLDPVLMLKDGNDVAVGIDHHLVEGREFRVRFVFHEGRLVIVSLRTPERTPALADAYQALDRHLAALIGRPGEHTADDSFVDMRQTRWNVGRSIVDLKYVAGALVVMWADAAAVP